VTRPHYLTPPAKGATPTAVVTFDTETFCRREGGSEVLTLRCWDALLRLRGDQAPGDGLAVPHSGETPGELVAVLEAAAELAGEAWAFAHNLGFDLTVTSLPAVLVERGWDASFVAIGDEACSFAFKRDGARLVVTDAWSWLRCSLERAAPDVGMRKTALPGEDDSLARWHRRCAHDVAILDALLVELLGWWDRLGVGAFGLTGAACGWRSLRSRVRPKRVLVGPEDGRTAFEREAIFGGRKEVWRVGRIRGRWVEDWDIASAYLTTVATMPLPVRPLRSARADPGLDPGDPPDGLGALARVKVTTDTPCAPVRVDQDVWWPVGTFWTVLTTPEIRSAREAGATVRTAEVAWYAMGDDLQDWGRWCLGLVDGGTPDAPRVARRVAKGWGRSVPGRFALRKPSLIGERPATHLGWALETGVDLRTGEQLEVVTFGGVERTYRKDQDGADVSPAVLAFVEGYVRAAMDRALRSRDPAQLLQCNTDGWWEVRKGRDPGEAGGAVLAPYRAVRKAVTRDVTVLGPNHTDALGDRRLAGVPAAADRALDGTYSWQDWPGLRWQLQNSRPGQYVRPGREMMLQAHYCRRWVLTSGETVPVSAFVDSIGRTILRPWTQTAQRRSGDVLAGHQVPALAAIASEGPSRASSGLSRGLSLPGRSALRAPGPARRAGRRASRAPAPSAT
jgi:hypothetical protein